MTAFYGLLLLLLPITIAAFFTREQQENVLPYLIAIFLCLAFVGVMAVWIYGEAPIKDDPSKWVAGYGLWRE